MPVAAVIGFPVRQSLSPAIHLAAARARGLDLHFLQLAFPPDAGGDAVRALRLLDVVGASVTMPHKRTVIAHLDGLDVTARAVDAVNTIARDGTRYIGHNTDGTGFVRSLTEDASCDPEGRTALILGAGGAARGVAVALADAGASVVICARRPEQAREIAALRRSIATGSWDDPGEADIIVNATPAREGLPLDRLSFAPGVVAVDMIYAPPRTLFIREALAAGSAAFDGLGMLIHQAALAFELWMGTDAPIEEMWRAGRAALARDHGE